MWRRGSPRGIPLRMFRLAQDEHRHRCVVEEVACHTSKQDPRTRECP